MSGWAQARTPSAPGERACPRCKGRGWVGTAGGPGVCNLCAGNGVTTTDERAQRRLEREAATAAERAWRNGPTEHRASAGVLAHLRCYHEALNGARPLPPASKVRWGALAEAYGLPPLPAVTVAGAE